MEQDIDLAQKVAHYSPSEEALASVRQVPLLLAVGISGAGKDTVLHHLAETYPGQYKFSVSHTTRPMRENNGVHEQNGVEYYFIDKATANKMLDEGALIEANMYASNVYGASIAEIKRAGADGKILISDIDVNGVGNFVRRGLNAKAVFLLPPSFEVWQQRLQKRYGGEVNIEDMRKRLRTALDELENALANDYFYIVVNDDLEKTVSLVNDIAHGRSVEARYPKALELARDLATKTKEALRNL